MKQTKQNGNQVSMFTEKEIAALNAENYIVFDIETTGKSPWWGNPITVICAKTIKGDWFSGYLPYPRDPQKEVDLINNFLRWVSVKSHHKFITKKGKSFIIPFLYARMISNNMDVKKAYDIFNNSEIVDLDDLTSGNVSLDNFSRILGAGSKERKGKDAVALWNKNQMRKLIKYCKEDVILIEICHLKLNKLNYEGYKYLD